MLENRSSVHALARQGPFSAQPLEEGAVPLGKLDLRGDLQTLSEQVRTPDQRPVGA